jgi:hypothetical protein
MSHDDLTRWACAKSALDAARQVGVVFDTSKKVLCLDLPPLISMSATFRAISFISHGESGHPPLRAGIVDAGDDGDHCALPSGAPGFCGLSNTRSDC